MCSAGIQIQLLHRTARWGAELCEDPPTDGWDRSSSGAQTLGGQDYGKVHMLIGCLQNFMWHESGMCLPKNMYQSLQGEKEICKVCFRYLFI